ncbi:uncharacterized protein LOC106179220 [Lingula anatina]|uniref:Uncharacterized protein LOC106179220 n=1 Tax=Lingula anatina TaxID=7574 RepID=A0A1S3K6F1_LINAN|nr:uncharacterized protein LOC106179220 [Lingula anatina]|eukprot:XP_013418210.1 uncharacterized protein LOC106179220 [Lingula anatina]
MVIILKSKMTITTGCVQCLLALLCFSQVESHNNAQSVAARTLNGYIASSKFRKADSLGTSTSKDIYVNLGPVDKPSQWTAPGGSAPMGVDAPAKTLAVGMIWGGSPPKTFVSEDVTLRGVDCIILQLNALFELPYTDRKNLTRKALFLLSEDSGARAEGECGSEAQFITIMMFNKAVNYTLIFSNSSDGVRLANSTLRYNTRRGGIFHNAKGETVSLHLTWVSAKISTAPGAFFKCVLPSFLHYEEGARVAVDNLRVVAFNDNNDTEHFGGGPATTCTQDVEVAEYGVIKTYISIFLTGIVVVLVIVYLIRIKIKQRRKTSQQLHTTVPINESSNATQKT